MNNLQFRNETSYSEDTSNNKSKLILTAEPEYFTDPEVKEYFIKAGELVKSIPYDKQLEIIKNARDSMERRLLLFKSLSIPMPEIVKIKIDDYIRELNESQPGKEVVLSEFRRWITKESVDMSHNISQILGDYIGWYRREAGKHLSRESRLIIREYLTNKE